MEGAEAGGPGQEARRTHSSEDQAVAKSAGREKDDRLGSLNHQFQASGRGSQASEHPEEETYFLWSGY